MSQVWSEINKVVNCMIPNEQSGTSGIAVSTDVINLENYKACTFILAMGTTAANEPLLHMFAGADSTSAGVVTSIDFKYRTQIAGIGGSSGGAGSDAPSALTQATTDGLTLLPVYEGSTYIIEVDPAVVAEAGTNFDHCKLTITNTDTVGAMDYGVVAVLSEPRYPQAILQTAID